MNFKQQIKVIHNPSDLHYTIQKKLNEIDWYIKKANFKDGSDKAYYENLAGIIALEITSLYIQLNEHLESGGELPSKWRKK